MTEEEAPEEEAPKKKAPAKKTPAKKETVEEAPIEAVKPKKMVYKKIRCNLWRTRLHAEELGVYQALKYQAKTRYFAKDFDIEGVVEVDDEKKYVIAFNKQDWEEGALEEKRLTLRLFTILEEKMGVGKGGNFKGGVELSITHSLVQTAEIKYPAPVFFIQSPRTTSLPRIVRGHRFIGTRWTFPILPEEKDDQFIIVLAKGVIAPGNDYNIYIGKKKVARVDHQRVTKDVEIEIYDEEYAKDKTFVDYMTLFGCICFFMKDAYKLIKSFTKDLKDTGTTDYKPPKMEMDLFKNPRLMRR
ncbi:MAG: hypothetical protein EU535_01230 [Promethearchaeota archaeon]|nr:MAG: hypothetical protein EU535_01230 [Candidatus Lokiarchaeota archaeon]